MPTDGGPVVKDVLSCLRLITCTDATERILEASAREAAYGAWDTARRDIYDEWMFATDPANLQPRVRPLLRRAAELVRKYPPEGLEQPAIDKVTASLEAPWGARIEHQIREAMAEVSDKRAAQRVAEAVRLLGLKPFEAPEPLPPIEMNEVSLVCWMAVVV